MTDDGRLVVRSAETGREFVVVDYADPLVRNRLASKSTGERLRLAVVPAGHKGTEWKVTRHVEGAPVPVAESDTVDPASLTAERSRPSSTPAPRQ